MLIPLGTDRLPKSQPITTITLVVLNLLIFIGVAIAVRAGATTHEEVIRWGAVSRLDFHPWSLVTSVFLHDPSGLGHVGFNMLFLWVFGQAVESRLGSLGFAAFYLVGGSAACLTHMVVTPAPAIGASGAVAAVSGAFLALFPRATVRVLLFFLLIGVYHVPAIWFICFYIAIDLLSQASSFLGRSNDVANAAHLGGYAFGFSTAIVLLAVGLLPRTDLDMLYLFKQRQRRKEMRSVAREFGSAFDHAGAAANAPRRISADTPAMSDEHAGTRSAIVQLLRADDTTEALARYRAAAEGVVLNDADQADLGNRAMASGDGELAARAYEALLRKRGERATGPGGPSDGFRLLLSSILIRRLDRMPEAIPHLDTLARRKLDPDSRDLLTALRAEAGLPTGPEDGTGRSS
ncbi:MAG: rhomboid family intramembrane serine protease [Phycisphaera sp.]|nr:rhomboid family intramembrane serine protease [Phycisphaera sp.]